MISIIIPAKNEAANLWFTIHAIRIEMERNPAGSYEIVVVDNGSTDTTKAFLEDPAIAQWVRRVETTDRSGPGPVRNAGAEAAQGDILIFADAHVLFSSGFFQRVSSTMRDEIWNRVGSLHFPCSWNGFTPTEFSTHYELTLEQNFWGNNLNGGFQTLTEIAAHGHGCVAVRKDRFFEVGGYHPAQAGYGGDETYLDLKFAMFGFRNYSDPRAYYLHCSQRRQNYVWVNQDVDRNNFISAYTLGGAAWLDKVYASQAAMGQKPEEELQAARMQALAAGQADRKWIEAHAKYTVDEVLAGFRARQVPLSMPNGMGSGTPLAEMGFDEIMLLLRETDPSSALHARARQLLEGKIEREPAIPKATAPTEPKFLTIGMATHNDYDGCYFSIQSMRLYHPEVMQDVEILVIDNDPAGPCANALKALENWAPNYRYIPYRSFQGTTVRDLIFREATGEFVLCMDSHVLLRRGALARLIAYCREHPDSRDLLQGPLVWDDLSLSTHFDPVWSDGMYGYWGKDERGDDLDGPPFDIGMQGLGVFACRRQAWPGFNPRLAGFGGEEGYIHEKFRRAGGRTLCLPFLRWAHRFERPMGVPYTCNWEDRIRNYLLTYDELGMDAAAVIAHFEGFLGRDQAQEIVQKVEAEMAGPFHYFDAIYCINLDAQTDRWQNVRRRFQKLGIERRVRRFAAVETPSNHHIGCTLSHRRIIAEAKRQNLKSVLVFEDDVRFTADAADVLKLSLQELESYSWNLLYLGGFRNPGGALRGVPGAAHLQSYSLLTCTHAIAYHHSVYDAILDAIPDDPIDVALWAREHAAIDQYLANTFGDDLFLTHPVIASQSSIMEAEGRAFED